MSESAVLPLIHRPAIRQFVKFCIIGATSTVIDFGIFFYLVQGRPHLYWVLAQTISFSVAVTNGYIWNSIWTFKGLGSGPLHHLYGKFVLVNIVGFCLNIAIIKAVAVALTGQFIQHGNPPDLDLKIAKCVAVVCVSLWNFAANKRWTFR